ncbi:MAG: phage antirepressor N-terminal domain-containing protein [Candidatus Paceibacterota bacterium]
MDKEKNTSPQYGILQEYEYSKTLVLAGISPLGEMIAIKPVCENMGIDRKWQQDKIKADPYLGSTGGMVKVVAQDGKLREMYCLPPQAFQDWLYGLTATENMNREVWEDYKKGLVLHLLIMLKVSFEEIYRLRVIEDDFLALRKDVLHLMKTHDEKDNHSNIVRQLGKDYKTIRDRIVKRVTKDLDQIPISFN